MSAVQRVGPWADGGHRADAPEDLPAQTARAAALTLDLSRSRRIVYVGGEGEVLAEFLDAWPQLRGVWVGPAAARVEAQRFLGQRGLDARVRYQAGDKLDTIPAADLVVLTAVDAAVDRSLQLLASAGPGWLPAGGRWLILQREHSHLASVIGPPLLQGLGLRVASQWPLAAVHRMLVCAPALRFSDAMLARSDHLVASPRAQ